MLKVLRDRCTSGRSPSPLSRETARSLVGGLALAAAIAAAPTLTGCGGTLYAVQATAASSKLNEAKAIGAEQLAPYEFYLADEFMKKASEEASRADYGDAVDFAEKAEVAADKAIRLARDARKGAGR